MGAYRPSIWSSPVPARVMLTFPGQPQNSQYSGAVGGTASLPASQTQYVFDAVLNLAHEQEMRTTEHPVQTGASISDHAYIVPARLVLEIGMSDAMDAFFSPSTWTGAPSKSVSAYQTLLAIEFARIPISITTRLRTYSNMVIRAVNPNETSKTTTGLRARIELIQIFMATTLQTQSSARLQETGQTNLGGLTTQPLTPAQQSQNSVVGLGGVSAVPSSALGAGSFSSVNVNNLTALPAAK